jgi:hypothetical protein
MRRTDTSPRFIAEWISAQHHDDAGEWLPDDDEYSIQYCSDLKEAQRVAVANGKSCNVVEWARVSEQHFNAELGIPARGDAAWDTVRVWHGDWQGNWDEDRS